MKKLLVFLVIVAIIVGGFYVYYMGLYDMRFWTYDENVYKPFTTGVYVAGKDIIPGSYDVEIRGKLDGYGSVDVHKQNSSNSIQFFFLEPGARGFHFSIEEGQVVEVTADSSTRLEMRIRKSESIK